MGDLSMEEINKTEIIKIEEADVPSLIHEQFAILSKYNEEFETAKKKADEVKQHAVEAKEKGVRLFKMKKSIKDLQENQLELSESNMISVELQEESLKFQKKLSETMQYLLGLGVANISLNRCVVKELQMRLDNASEEEIDEMTKEEIMKVIRQLKAQEDLFKKTMEITGKVKEHENKLIVQQNKDIEHDLRIEEHENKFVSQENKDIEHDRKLLELSESNKQLKSEIKKLQAYTNKTTKIIIGLWVAFGVTAILAIVSLVFEII